MKKFLSLISLMLGVFFTFTACGDKTTKPEDESVKVRVGVTIYPLKYFTEAIGGDKVDVFSIIPDGSDAHSFDPKPMDLKDLNNTDIFVYNGLGMEEWIDSILNTLEGTDVKKVEASNGIVALSAIGDNDHEHEEESDHEHAEEGDHEHAEESDHDHNHGGSDPHVWLSLTDAIVQAENIKNALTQVDQENKDYYEENYNNLVKEFTSLKDEYLLKFNSISNKNFVTGHAAFGYLCRDFGLIQSSIADVFGEGELTPKDLEALMEYSKANNVKVIFSESTASEKEAETLAKEVGARVEKIYALETQEDGMNYIDAMRYNLETIYNALK